MVSKLDRIQVAAPCPARWEDMKGDERSRHCAQCDLRVYNLAGMKRVDAERLVNEAEGRTCVRFFRRPDGTILTDDCPVGLAARARRTVRRAVVFVTGILGLGVVGGLIERKLAEKVNYPPVAGAMVCPPTPPTPTTLTPQVLAVEADAPVDSGVTDAPPRLDLEVK